MINEKYFWKARYNMVYNQLVPCGIVDENLLNAFLKIPRHRFIVSNWRKVAYTDAILPIWDTKIFVEDNRFVMPPLVLSKMLQSANITTNSIVLDFYCNTGYSSVILSDIAKKVIAVDVDKKLLNIGVSEKLLLQAQNRVLFKLFQDFVIDHEKQSFDVIMVNGIINYIPSLFKCILIEGGRIVFIKKKDHVAQVIKYIKHKNSLFIDDSYVVDADERLLVKLEPFENLFKLG